MIMSLTGNAFIFVSHANDPFSVWNELCAEYEPKEDMDLYDIKESFANCKLKHDIENVPHACVVPAWPRQRIAFDDRIYI